MFTVDITNQSFSALLVADNSSIRALQWLTGRFVTMLDILYESRVQVLHSALTSVNYK